MMAGDTAPSNALLWKKVVLLVLLLGALWMLCNDDFSVLEALNRHEPSARIFRALLEVDLLVFGAAFSLYIWSRTIGVEMVAHLFFPDDAMMLLLGYDSSLQQWNPQHHQDENDLAEMRFETDDTGIHARHHHHRNDDTLVDVTDADADYESDGEIPAPRNIKRTRSEDDIVLDSQDGGHTRVPSTSSVLGAALDTLLLILVALFLFSLSAAGLKISHESSPNDDDQQDWTELVSRVAAPTFPLLLFVYLLAVMLFSKKRRAFWRVLSYTLAAPFYDVTFRDGFVGDVLTSSVRPLQDITFTIVYLLYGLQGWWSQSYYDTVDPANYVGGNETNSTHEALGAVENTRDDQTGNMELALLPVMEKSWVLHTILLPLCVVSPLWWRYLQNLRQTADFKQRWPYLGNAAKYFCAAQVAVFGVFYPEWQKSPYWLLAFCAATLYQIWWDVFMDWGLLERNKKKNGSFFSFSWQLRKERLFPNRWAYWSIALINFVLRFCWTLSFLPTRYLHPAGFLVKQNKFLVTPTIASAEIIRRTLWGLLRFEYEAVKINRTTHEFVLADGMEDSKPDNQDSIELTSMKIIHSGKGGDDDDHRTTFDNNDYETRIPSFSDMSSMNGIQILGELSMYAATFVALWLLAADHRGTL
jgi:hypothetical protein